MKRLTALLAFLALASCTATHTTPRIEGRAYVGIPDRTDSWFSLHRARARQYAGISSSLLGGWEMDLVRGATAEGYSTAVAGTGAVTVLTQLGGRVQITTGATASSNARFFGGNLTVAPKNERWYIACRLRVVTTSDAAADMRICGLNNALASDNVRLTITNGVMSLVLMAGGSTTSVASTWTVETTSYHDMAIAFDTATVNAFVDGAPVASTSTLTNLPTVDNNMDSTMQNGATAADRQIIMDKLGLYVSAP